MKPTALVALVVAALSSFLIAPATTRAQLGCYCGQPLSGIPDTAPERPEASDCLFILNVGIGLQACAYDCVCDVDASGGAPNASDALICLNAAVGIPDLLACECAEPPCQSTAACSELEIRLSAGSELDAGWTGGAHDSPLPDGAPLHLGVVRRCGGSGSICEVDADCPGDSCDPTCECDGNDDATCEVAGPVGAQRRCRFDIEVECETDNDCRTLAGETCKTFLGAPFPLTAATGLPLCVTTFADNGVAGVFDPALGTFELAGEIRSRPNFGISPSQPCPRCGTPNETPAVGDSFVCEGGPRDGEPCIVGTVSPYFGGTSLDCPPQQMLATGVEFALYLFASTAARKSLDAIIPCGGTLAALHPSNGGSVCLDTFVECSTNADCMRCTGAPTTACTSNSDCPGNGTCAAAPEQPISCGIYCHCGFCDDDPDQPCNTDTDCDFGETCAQGPSPHQQLQGNKCTDLTCGLGGVDQCCSSDEPTCVNPTAKVGRCALAPYISCTNDSDCSTQSAGTCTLVNRPCFENRIERTGTPSPLGSYCIDDRSVAACTSNADCASGRCLADSAAPTLVDMLCVPATQSASINNEFGLAGPAAMSLKTAIRVHRCGDGRIGGIEACDDGNTANGDGCDEICRSEP